MPAILLLVAFSPIAAQTLNRCVPFFTSELVSFDLTSLDASLNGANYSVAVRPHTNPKTNKSVVLSKVEFKVCGIATRPSSCPEVPGGAFSYYYADGVCYPQNVLLSTQDKEVIKVNSKSNGIVLTYSNKNLPEDLKKVTGPDLRFKITCNKEKTGVAQWSETIDNGVIVFSTEHAAGCPKALDDLLELVKMYKWFFAAGFIAIGIVFAFFGRNAYKWTLFLAGFILGFLLVAIVCYSFGLFHNSTDGKKYAILAISLLVGLLVGFILYKVETFTVMIVCGVLSSMIFMAVMTTFFANNNLEKWVLLAITIGVGVVGGVLGGCYKE